MLTLFKNYRFVFFLLVLHFLTSCNESKTELDDFEFWKINIVTPNPQKTLDSLINLYNLQNQSEVAEYNGFISGSLELANASLQIKKYLDTAEHSTGPTEITILTNLPDSVAYKKLKEKGLEVNKPFRREGWNFSVITIPDLKIFGDKSNGIYICKFDGTQDDMIENAIWRDSIRSQTNVRLNSIDIFAPNAEELKENFYKLNLQGENFPKFKFISDSIYRMEIHIK